MVSVSAFTDKIGPRTREVKHVILFFISLDINIDLAA